MPPQDPPRQRDDRSEIADAFERAAERDEIVAARFGVFDTARSAIPPVADRCHAAGFLFRDDFLLATALLARFAVELVSGFAGTIRDGQPYAAAALLRQFIEVEYLAFLGYSDPARLSVWYRSNPAALRKEFTPQRMRDASGGLFRDDEYWLHCDIGGHPHPKARLILPQYSESIDATTFLLPDGVHHFRRFWTSSRLSLERRTDATHILEDDAATLGLALTHWESVEDPLILEFDGINRNAIEE